MDEAWCPQRNELVTSEDLYIIDTPSALSFQCNECEIELIPCSYIKDVNRRKPYFKTRKGMGHIPALCTAEGKSQLKLKGLKQSLSTEEGFPLPYPNKFKLKKEDATDTPETSTRKSKSGKASIGHISSHSDSDEKDEKKTYETTSFKSIVNQYFDFPHDRQRALIFEGIEGNTYDNIFSRIKSPTGKQQFLLQGQNKKIYYGTLGWRAAKLDGDILKIFLTNGLWKESNGTKKLSRPYYLEINTSDWPKQSVTKLIKTHEKVVDTVKGTETKAVLSFVGSQDCEEDYFRYYASHRLLIAFKIFSNITD